MDRKSVTRDPYQQVYGDIKALKVEADVYSQYGASFNRSAEEMIPLGKGFRSNSDLFNIINRHCRAEEEYYHMHDGTINERSSRNNHSLFQPQNVWMMNTYSAYSMRPEDVSRSFIPLNKESSLL
jgi:hypothetical protein